MMFFYTSVCTVLVYQIRVWVTRRLGSVEMNKFFSEFSGVLEERPEGGSVAGYGSRHPLCLFLREKGEWMLLIRIQERRFETLLSLFLRLTLQS